MPNQPRKENRHRMVRVEDELWNEAGRLTAAHDTTRSVVMREALAAWVEAHRDVAYCDRGPCSALKGHEGTCDEASGWTEEA